eukprot:scaffold15922_cov104-Skeletonema_dohrnii-CCMP3373.AAC.2
MKSICCGDTAICSPVFQLSTIPRTFQGEYCMRIIDCNCTSSSFFTESRPLSPHQLCRLADHKVLHLCGGVIALFWCSWDILALPLFEYLFELELGFGAALPTVAMTHFSLHLLTQGYRAQAQAQNHHHQHHHRSTRQTISLSYHIDPINQKVIAAALLTLLSTYTVTGKSGVECNQETIQGLWQCKDAVFCIMYHSSYHSYTHQSHTELINSR